MKNTLMLLALLLLALSAVMRIGSVSRVNADTNCNPATCGYGWHSVCKEECDPNYLNCTVRICKCHCEKDPDPK
jgi:hypothetical protein